MDKDVLIEAGIDYDDGIRRCVGSVLLYERLLGMFLDDVNFSEAKDRFDKGDYQGMYSHVHELKGMSGNLSIGVLYQASSHTVDVLRAQEWDLLPDSFAELERAYSSAVGAIRSAGVLSPGSEG